MHRRISFFIVVFLFFCLSVKADNSLTTVTVDLENFPVPVNLSATVINSTQINLNWDNVVNAVSYKIYRNSVFIGSSSSNSYNDTGLSLGATYSYSISGINTFGGESDQSLPVSVTISSGGGGGGAGLFLKIFSPPIPPGPSQGNPNGGFRVLINQGKKITFNRMVDLNLFAGSNTERMAISEDSSFKYAFQEQYQEEKTWTLSDGEGEKTIYVKFYTREGKSSDIFSATITYSEESSFKEKIIERVREIIKKISEPEIAMQIPPEKIAKIIIEPGKIKPLEAPIEELAPKEALLAPQKEKGNEFLTEFTLMPLLEEIKELAKKFPQLEKTFEELGIEKITDLAKLRTVKLTLPGLTERVGLPTTEIEPGKFALPKAVPISKLSSEFKQKLPSEIVFAKTGGELIDFAISLTFTEQGKLQQRIKTISGKPLQLIVKPSQPVKSVKGYVVFRSGKPQEISSQLPFNYLTASIVFASQDLVQPQEQYGKVEEKLILLKFEYTDPDEDGIYTAEIQAPLVEGEYEIITVLDFEDEELGAKEIQLIIVVDPEGYIFEKQGRKETRISRAIVSLYWLNTETKQYQLWPANEYQQENPQITDATGKYSFLAPEGSYYLKVEAPNYLVYEGKPFQFKEANGVNINIELKTEYWWLKVVDIKIILLIISILLLLFYNFYRGKIRKRKES
ncbi:hypothetical protein KJ973_03415 [Patescibacteria group bacterium]|nr:hypothetical protein [Patescibacteria group bacterium]MBU1519713.1 hypothetical protein [Patescibacteria group bacterium]MBU2416609.1 hypothetical protein [Patescibacteria group bacterium]MBU2460754.1 hypothetical protein [Patescibacteria group bacterium]